LASPTQCRRNVIGSDKITRVAVMILVRPPKTRYHVQKELHQRLSWEKNARVKKDKRKAHRHPIRDRMSAIWRTACRWPTHDARRQLRLADQQVWSWQAIACPPLPLSGGGGCTDGPFACMRYVRMDKPISPLLDFIPARAPRRCYRRMIYDLH